MEPIGITVGIAGLAGSFGFCLDCFDYVQLACNFGEDYGKCVLRLDAAKLRFSRWGVSVGLGPQVTQREDLMVPREEYRLAQRLLGQISICFMNAEKVSRQYQQRALVQDTDVSVLALADTEADLGLEYQCLHDKMRELASKRQRQTSFATKTKWALYEKRKFDEMINDLSIFIKELDELFPSQEQRQKELCRYEVQSVNGDERKLLSTISAEDGLMQSTIMEDDPRGHSAINWTAGGNPPAALARGQIYVSDHATVHIGDQYFMKSAEDFYVSDYATVHIGDQYLMKSAEDT